MHIEKGACPYCDKIVNINIPDDKKVYNVNPKGNILTKRANTETRKCPKCDGTIWVELTDK